MAVAITAAGGMMTAGEAEAVMVADSAALVAAGPVAEAQPSKIKQVSSVNKRC